MSLNILFAGVPAFALQLIQEGRAPKAVVLPSLDDEPDTHALILHCSRAGIPVFPSVVLSKDASRQDRMGVEAAGPFDVLLVMNFHRQIPPWALQLGSKAALNVHPSLLPRHRGYNPYYWTIRHGDAEGGVSIHHMTAEFDDGDVVAQARFSIPARMASGELWEALNDLTMPLLLPLLDLVDAGKPLPRLAQDETLATHDPKPSQEELTLEPNQPVEAVLAHIRAATPEPGLFLDLGGRLLVVRGAVKGPKAPAGSGPGDLFVHDGMACVVTAGQGSFAPLDVEEPGGPVDLAAWVLSRRGTP